MQDKKSLKIFLISFAAVFLMVLIPHLKTKTTVLQNPRPVKADPYFKLKTSVVPTVSAGSDYDNATAYGVIDFDSGQVIASKNLAMKLPMASLTKVMTAIISLDLAKEDEEFTVSQRAALQPPTKVMLKPGEHYPLLKLLKFSLITSSNDATQVIQEGIDAKFGPETFINAMNFKAKFLGLKNTHFVNAQGYDDPGHYSTIEDLSILSHYAMKNYPLIAKIVGEDFEDLTQNNQDLRFYLNNWNGLLDVYPGVEGVKTGNTDNAGICTIVLSHRGDNRVLAIVLGASGIKERDIWASQLLDLGFNRLANLPPVNVSEDQLKEKYASWKYF